MNENINVMKVKKRSIGLIFIALSLWFPLNGKAQSAYTETFQACVDSVIRLCVPDKRVELFDVSIDVSTGGETTVRGRTTSLRAKQELLRLLAKSDIHPVDRVDVWPFDELGDEMYGVVDLSVVCIHSDPYYGAEMSTQGLLGMPIRIVEDGTWLRIQTPDGYIGWVTSGGIARMNRTAYNAWLQAPKIICTVPAGTAYSKPSKSSDPISDLVCGNVLKVQGVKKGFYQVVFPGGREAYVSCSDAEPVEQWRKGIRLTATSLLKVARSLMGVPYVWGGTSSKGVDCSGLIKVTTFMHGLILQRDASQQAYTGHPVDIRDGYDQLRPGDLLFFGTPASDGKRERIVHVAFYLGDKSFIHASDRVRVNSLDPNRTDYDAYNTRRLVKAVRILDAIDTPGIETWGKNEFYQLQ